MTTYYGTTNGDSIIGSSSPDVIYGYEKDSFPENEMGNDYLRGGAGNDRIYGGGGDDTLIGDEGGDTLWGGDGADLMIGGEGNDVFDGGAGDDIMTVADYRRDYFQGGSGTDTMRLDNNIACQFITLDATASVEVLDLAGFVLAGTSLGDIYDFSGLSEIRQTAMLDLAAGDDRYQGHIGRDSVSGGLGDDELIGNGGNDRLAGGAGEDTLSGGAGNDLFLIADSDSDIYRGGSGSDTIRLSGNAARASFILDRQGSVEHLELGKFRLSGSSGDDIFDLTRLATLTGSARLINLAAGDDTFTGWSGADTVAGGDGADRITTAGGRDSLDGGTGKDMLSAGTGNDRLTGGAGADKMLGGSDDDIFVFRAAADSTLSRSGRDTIMDFAKGDELDLSAIDANARRGGNQTFDFIGTDAFSHTAGELRYQKADGDVLVYGDTNGDGKADFAIRLADHTLLAPGDFAL